MKPELQAYRFYKKNFDDLWERFIAHTQFGYSEGFDNLNKYMAEKFDITEQSFVDILAKAYDKEGERFERGF